MIGTGAEHIQVAQMARREIDVAHLCFEGQVGDEISVEFLGREGLLEACILSGRALLEMFPFCRGNRLLLQGLTRRQSSKTVQ